MKLAVTLVPLTALGAAAFLIPDEKLARQFAASDDLSESWLDAAQDKVQNIFSKVTASVENAVDVAFAAAEAAEDNFATSLGDLADDYDSVYGGHHGHHKPDRTVYELINESKYTTILAKYINKYPDLVEALNGTAANYTVFAPTDEALEHMHRHHPDHDLDKDTIKNILAYHVSADFYPAGRVLQTHTIPSIYGEKGLTGNPQRIRVGLGLKGLRLNFYAKVIAINIFGTNGVIHGINRPLLPPPSLAKIIDLMPGEFSTLRLALEKSGLWDKEAHKEHTDGVTVFAPNNFAFKSLGVPANAFLFSKAGHKYLAALLKYHVVPEYTIYSDAYYHGKPEHDKEAQIEGCDHKQCHAELKTDLEGKTLSLDVARWGPGFITMRVNGFTTVTRQDGVAKDGVIQEISSVLIPPHSHKGKAEAVTGEISVEDLKDRLTPWVEEL